jgi:formylglycine-generating enzyme required for sulfatase activity
VRLPAGAARYRAAGEFTRDGRPVEAPKSAVRVGALLVMRNQVSGADYQACVEDGACAPLAKSAPLRADLPAIGVSWQDARAYAAWLSRRTGRAWRLPTDREWVRFAGERAADDALVFRDDPADPSRRWLAMYEQESGRAAQPDSKAARPFGFYGVNRSGVEDVAGNVWEWTDSCYERVALDRFGRPSGAATVNCGVRVVEGRHRTYMVDFVRDPRVGGCAVGTPPANLGFRLVADEPGPVEALASRLARAFERNG